MKTSTMKDETMTDLAALRERVAAETVWPNDPESEFYWFRDAILALIDALAAGEQKGE